MAILVDPSQSVSFNTCTKHTDNQRRNQQTHPEPQRDADLISEVCTQHIKAGMSEVQNAHHREDKRKAGGEHKQQQSSHKPVDYVNEDEFHWSPKGLIKT